MIDLRLQNYVDWHVKPVMKIKGNYGYRVILKYQDGSEKTQQKSGFRTMRYAIGMKVITVNPAVGVNLPKAVKKSAYHARDIDTQKTLTMEQITVLLEKSRDTPIHMQVLFNILMGLRRSEIIAVKYSDVDYVNRTLRVERQLGIILNSKKDDFAPKTYTKQEISPKTRSTREVPIPDYVFEAILREREKYEKNRSRRSTVFQDLDYICCSAYGRPRSRNYHWKHYKKILQDNHLPDIRWHDLRSTFCTLLLKNDFNPKAVLKLMGHSKEIITMDVYGDNKGIIHCLYIVMEQRGLKKCSAHNLRG